MPIKKILLSCAVLILLNSMSGCLSLNNSDEESVASKTEGNPEVYLTYPVTPEIMTLSDKFTLFGASNDAEFISEIKVNGQSVSTEDDFNTWQVELSLFDTEDLAVSIMVTNKNQSEMVTDAGLTIKQREVVPMTMGALAYSSHTDQIYFFDTDVDLLQTWDLNTERVSKLNTFGQWDDTITSVISMQVDELGEYVYYSDNDGNIYKLELATGISVAISLNSDYTGTVNEFRFVRNFYLIDDDLIIYNYSGDNAGLFYINIEDGTRTLLHSLGDIDVKSVEFSANANTFYIGGFKQVLTFDLGNNQRAVLSENLENDEILFDHYIYDLAVIDGENGDTRILIPVLTHEEFYYLDVSTSDGSRTKLLDQGEPALEVSDIGSMVVDHENNRIFIEDSDLNRIYQLDINTMTRTLVDGVSVNASEKTFLSQSLPSNMAYSHDGSSVFMLEDHRRSFFGFGFDVSKAIYFDTPEEFGWREHYIESYSPETSQVFITEFIENRDEILAENILIMNTQTEEMSVLIADRSSDSMIYNPDAKTLYVAVEGDLNIAEFDLDDLDNITEESKVCSTNENSEASYEFLTMDSGTGRLFLFDDEDSNTWMWNIETNTCEILFSNSDSRLDDIDGASDEYTLFDAAQNRLIFLAGNRVSIVAYNLETDTFDVLIENFTAGAVSQSYYDFRAVIFDLENQRLYFTDERSATLESLHVPTGEYHIHIH